MCSILALDGPFSPSFRHVGIFHSVIVPSLSKVPLYPPSSYYSNVHSMTWGSHENETWNMLYFCNFLRVQNISSEAVFCAVNGISQVNGPIISHWDPSRGCIWWADHGNHQKPLPRKLSEERKKRALKNRMGQVFPNERKWFNDNTLLGTEWICLFNWAFLEEKNLSRLVCFSRKQSCWNWLNWKIQSTTLAKKGTNHDHTLIETQTMFIRCLNLCMKTLQKLFCIDYVVLLISLVFG